MTAGLAATMHLSFLQALLHPVFSQKLMGKAGRSPAHSLPVPKAGTLQFLVSKPWLSSSQKGECKAELLSPGEQLSISLRWQLPPFYWTRAESLIVSPSWV